MFPSLASYRATRSESLFSFKPKIQVEKVARALLVANVSLIALDLLQSFFSRASASPCPTGVSQEMIQAQNWSTSIELLKTPLVPSYFAGKAVEWIAHLCGLLRFDTTTSVLEESLTNAVNGFNAHLPSEDSSYIAVVSKEQQIFSRALCTSLETLPVEVTTKTGILEALKKHPKVDRIVVFGDFFETISEETDEALKQLWMRSRLQTSRRNCSVSVISPILLPIDESVQQAVQKGTLWLAPYRIEIEDLFAQTYFPNQEQNIQILAAIREQWRPFVEWKKRANSPLHRQLKNFADENENGTYVIPSSNGLVPSRINHETTLFLSNALVIKPLQGDCVSEGKLYSKQTEYKQRQYKHIPPYGTVFRRAAVSDIAHLAGIGSMIPRADLAVIQSKEFGERLCAIEEYVSNKYLFKDVYQSAHMRNTYEFDRENIAQYLFFSFLIGNLDMHYLNVFIRLEGGLLSLISVDHDETFPTKNGNFKPCFQHFGSLICFTKLFDLKEPLTLQMRSFIKTFPFKQSCQILKDYGLENAIPAFKERYRALKKWVRQPEITLHEICEKMYF